MVQRAKLISLNETGLRYVASRYNVRTYDEQDNLLLYNSYTGNFRKVPHERKEETILLLDKGAEADSDSPLVPALFADGFLVRERTDEFMRAAMQQKQMQRNDRVLHLILMPNENCNFRCVYCYESFAKNKMDEKTQKGVVEYVRRELYKYDMLHVAWFGGEPLTAMEIIESLSEQFLEIVREQGKLYYSNMTTNGYNLTPRTFYTLYKLGMRDYQITFDGTKETHDTHRIQIDGSGTFDVIFENLKAIKTLSLRDFIIKLRSNVDQANQYDMTAYMNLMQETFGDDPRFSNHFVPVQQLGGENDTNMHLCDTKDIIPLMQEGIEMGLRFEYKGMFNPAGSTCYAARPNSFVIGSDGMVYKCTVAFDDERNHVGQLHEDGQMELFYERLMLWVANGAAEDSRCQKCFFRPSCQGEACPLEKIESGKTPCPPTKKNIKAYMKMLDAQGDIPWLELAPAVVGE
ncbi:radical SAM protein [Tumebacillus sp. ITR2]|uniref:Radical SAM protein n=1 Tax=Tumebacillus amylolyticus TaxID=2801339 RepID=A0ABS1J4M9_9BACL|nr:radical SAM protein [Tumebacillus amylolyticus]MBL0385140.1 radical SAM protein [Tumebacillus amylolyticus]